MIETYDKFIKLVYKKGFWVVWGELPFIYQDSLMYVSQENRTEKLRS